MTTVRLKLMVEQIRARGHHAAVIVGVGLGMAMSYERRVYVRLERLEHALRVRATILRGRPSR